MAWRLRLHHAVTRDMRLYQAAGNDTRLYQAAGNILVVTPGRTRARAFRYVLLLPLHDDGRSPAVTRLQGPKHARLLCMASCFALHDRLLLHACWA